MSLAGSPVVIDYPSIFARLADWSVYADSGGTGPLNQTSGFTKVQVFTNDTAYLFQSNGSTGFPQPAPAVAEDGAWHHWAMSYNASTSTLTQSLDGVVGRVLTLGGALQPFYDATSSVHIAYRDVITGGANMLVSNMRLVTDATLLPYAVNYTVPTSPLGTFDNGTTALLLRCVAPPPPPSPLPPYPSASLLSHLLPPSPSSPLPPTPPPSLWQYAGAFVDVAGTGRTMNSSATSDNHNSSCVFNFTTTPGVSPCALPSPTNLSACEAWAAQNGFNTIGLQNGGKARALAASLSLLRAVHAAALSWCTARPFSLSAARSVTAARAASSPPTAR